MPLRLLATAVLLALGLACQREEPLPALWAAPAFSLVDQQARPFGSTDLAGRAAVVSFVYTTCPDVCPTLSATFSQVQDRLRADGLLGSRVVLLSITVDPDRDTPPVLAAYAARFRAAPDDWRFLTGERETVFEVLEGFKVTTRAAARAAAGADLLPHSTRFAVVDAAGQVRANLPGDEVSPEEVVRTVRRVLDR